ncbi:MAG: hypothetical protein LC800_23160 [Acidobacteria bacterium]|nr:hypothetical protein [Acidobacteriota bacterium]
MANDNEIGPSADEPSESEVKQGKEINPHRTADFGESGQHTPGGYYNQQAANEEHIDLDEQFDSSSKA